MAAERDNALGHSNDDDRTAVARGGGVEGRKKRSRQDDIGDISAAGDEDMRKEAARARDNSNSSGGRRTVQEWRGKQRQ